MKTHFSPKALSITFGIILVTFFIIFFVIRSISPSGSSSNEGLQSITIEANGKKVTVGADGSVYENGVLVDTWSREKTQAFFSYYASKYGSSEEGDSVITFIVNGEARTQSGSSNDELTQIVTGGGSGTGGNGGNGGGGTSGFFESPLATPTPPPFGESGPPPSPAPSWCIHWRLSYCADPPPTTSSPTSTPVSGPTPFPPDCNNEGNQQTGRTVIGNELCIPTPTP